jgi:hypothetical protein
MKILSTLKSLLEFQVQPHWVDKKVSDRINEVFLRSSFEVEEIEDPPVRHFRLRKRNSYLDVTIDPPKDGQVLIGTDRTDEYGGEIEREVNRILYAAQARQNGGCPAAEIFIASSADPTSVRIIESLNGLFTDMPLVVNDSVTLALPSRVTLYCGPTVDPKSGDIRTYVALDYPLLPLKPITRMRTVRELHRRFRSMQLLLVGRARFWLNDDPLVKEIW